MATGQTHGGKGSTTRPTDKKKYEDNWDAIFGKKHNKELNEKIDELFDEKEEKEEVWVRAKHQILSNRMRTPDGTMLESRHRHDYVTHLDANGKEYMLDGGLDYLRSSANGDEKFLTVYQDDPHEVIRLLVKWGTFGKNGDEPYKQIKIADMSTEHLQACLETQKATMYPAMYSVMQDELEYRDE
jgi:hypothetical protein